MKKLLGMIGVFGIFAATTANVVACGESPKENNDDNKEEENVAIFDIDRIYARNGTHLEIDLNKYTLLAQWHFEQFGLYPGYEELDFQIDYQPIDNFSEHTSMVYVNGISSAYDYLPPDTTEDNNKIAIHLNKMCNIWNHNVAGHYILNDHTLFLDRKDWF
jgi:hypothetical protein